MQSMKKRVVTLAFATLLCSGCSAQHQMSPREVPNGSGVANRRPCVANFSLEGGYWAGYTVKSFGVYPDSPKSETFAYLLSKISSFGYLIDSSDGEAGSIHASYPLTFGKGEATSLKTQVSRTQAGVRVDLTFLTGGMATFSIDEVRLEFCSILEGVPVREAVKSVETKAAPEPAALEKPPAVEKPVVVEDLRPSTAQTQPPPAPPGLVVIKKANLRAKADIKSRIVGTFKGGEKLEILDRSGDWYRVKSASGLTGWIFKTLVRAGD
jgi:hypothetical protein